MAGEGYNIPVSVSNAQTPVSGSEGQTYIQFGNGYLSGNDPLTVTPTSTATSSAANGNASSQQGASGADASTAGAEGSSQTVNYPLILGISALGLTLIGLAFFAGRKLK